MTDETKDFRYYADRAETLIDMIESHTPVLTAELLTKAAAVFAELAKAAPKAEPVAPVRCPEWLSRDIRDLPKGFIDYQCVLFAGHGVGHESSTGQYWLTEVTK